MICVTHKKCQKTSPGTKTDLLGQEFEKSENYLKSAHVMSVQNGSYAFPNELMRFRNEATPIWVEIKKHCKNAVTI